MSTHQCIPQYLPCIENIFAGTLEKQKYITNKSKYTLINIFLAWESISNFITNIAISNVFFLRLGFGIKVCIVKIDQQIKT